MLQIRMRNPCVRHYMYSRTMHPRVMQVYPVRGSGTLHTTRTQTAAVRAFVHPVCALMQNVRMRIDGSMDRSEKRSALAAALATRC
eukprot:COSAG03_NODE_21_length_21000_cov_26.440649_21_plen_86_part_00